MAVSTPGGARRWMVVSLSRPVSASIENRDSGEIGERTVRGAPKNSFEACVAAEAAQRKAAWMGVSSKQAVPKQANAAGAALRRNPKGGTNNAGGLHTVTNCCGLAHSAPSSNEEMTSQRSTRLGGIKAPRLDHQTCPIHVAS